jgi:phosphatidylserine decarboxylase
MAAERTGMAGRISADGWPVLAAGGLITIVLALLSVPLGAFALGLLFWLAHVLRHPRRMTPNVPYHVIAPADGTILDIQPDSFPGEGAGADRDPAIRITIVTRLSDAQAHLSPITGHITENLLLPGLFSAWGDTPASWRMARDVNERREIRIRDADRREVVVVQIATRTARHLVCRFAEGKFILAGDALGMARIAGVTDIFVPATCTVAVRAGQHVLAGETLLARFAKPKKTANRPIAEKGEDA